MCAVVWRSGAAGPRYQAAREDEWLEEAAAGGGGGLLAAGGSGEGRRAAEQLAGAGCRWRCVGLGSPSVLLSVALLTPDPPHADYSKVSKTPRRPYEKERLDSEMKVVGEFGLKNKREVWRIQMMLAKMRKNARDLLTLDEKNPKRIFEGAALLRRCARLGLLEEDKRELDYVLAIKTQDIMARRLQTLVFKQNLAKSLHHARVLIRQRHIR